MVPSAKEEVRLDEQTLGDEYTWIVGPLATADEAGAVPSSLRPIVFHDPAYCTWLRIVEPGNIGGSTDRSGCGALEARLRSNAFIALRSTAVVIVS